jgi:leucyl aminopeptidase (aminopeptidase T)
MWKIINESLAVRSGEEVLIVGDDGTHPRIIDALAAAVTAAGGSPNVILMSRRALPGSPATRPVASALLGSDVIIAPTSTGLGFTPEFNRALKENGARGLVMTATTPEMLTSGAGTADYAEVLRTTEPIAAAMNSGERIVVRSAAGSEFEASISGQPAGCSAANATQRGVVSAFPSGEAWQCPVTGTGNGVLVADGSAHFLGRLAEPVRVHFSNGRAVRIEGGYQAEELWDIVRGGERRDNLGELSIGTNRWARFTGNVTEDKKALGTSHFALGSSIVGGDVTSDMHIDLLMMKPTIWVDDRLIVEDGRVVITE